MCFSAGYPVLRWILAAAGGVILALSIPAAAVDSLPTAASTSRAETFRTPSVAAAQQRRAVLGGVLVLGIGIYLGVAQWQLRPRKRD